MLPASILADLSRIAIPARGKLLAVVAAVERARTLRATSAGDLREACALAAVDAPLSGDRLRVLYHKAKPADGWPGWTALIDHRLCGGCGLPGCAKKPRAPRRPAALDQEFIRRHESRQRSLSKKAAWLSLIADLKAGRELPGVGDWKRLFRAAFPRQDIPAVCPWDEISPPPGWHYSSFAHIPLSAVETLAAKRGHALPDALLYKIRRDTSALRPLEVLVFDDFRLDFLVTHAGQVCELWGVACMDLATRRVVGYGLRPRVTREDGRKDGITRRDMQHLIAGVIARFGVPPWGITCIVENAAAAVTDAMIAACDLVTGGAVTFRRTGVYETLDKSGFREKSGNPQAKAWIESYFNILQNRLDNLPGATGNSYRNKPLALDSRKTQALALVKAGQILSPTDAARLNLPLIDVPAAMRRLDGVLLELDQRMDHDMLGFEDMIDWKEWAGAPWRSASGADGEMWRSLTTEQRARCLTRSRKESPMERWARLAGGQEDWTRVGEEALAFLLMDEVRFKHKGGPQVTLTHLKKEFLFQGFDHRLQAGEEVTARFDSAAPWTGCFFVSRAGVYLGRMDWKPGIGVLDTEAAKRELGNKRHANHELAKTLSGRHITEKTFAEENAALDDNWELLDSYRGTAALRGDLRQARAASGPEKERAEKPSSRTPVLTTPTTTNHEQPNDDDFSSF